MTLNEYKAQGRKAFDAYRARNAGVSVEELTRRDAARKAAQADFAEAWADEVDPRRHPSDKRPFGPW